MASEQLTSGEAWILEACALRGLPVIGLTYNPKEMYDWLLRRHHGLNNHELRDTLASLCQRGYLEFSNFNDEAGFCPTLAEIEDSLQHWQAQIYCQVTPTGGELWETLAQPNWQRYFNDSYPESNILLLQTGSEERWWELAHNAERLWHIEIESTTLNVCRMQPWWPTHWKQLSCGFEGEIRFQHSDREEGMPVSEQQKLRQWAGRIC
jgi:hypothetical protein